MKNVSNVFSKVFSLVICGIAVISCHRSPVLPSSFEAEDNSELAGISPLRIDRLHASAMAMAAPPGAEAPSEPAVENVRSAIRSDLAEIRWDSLLTLGTQSYSVLRAIAVVEPVPVGEPIVKVGPFAQVSPQLSYYDFVLTYFFRDVTPKPGIYYYKVRTFFSDRLVDSDSIKVVSPIPNFIPTVTRIDERVEVQWSIPPLQAQDVKVQVLKDGQVIADNLAKDETSIRTYLEYYSQGTFSVKVIMDGLSQTSKSILVPALGPAPSNFRVAYGSESYSANISWTKNPGDLSYEIKRSRLDLPEEPPQIVATITATDSNSYSVTGPISAGEFLYSATATTAQGPGAPATAYMSGWPLQPDSILATWGQGALANQVTLSWKNPDFGNTAASIGYELYVRKSDQTQEAYYGPRFTGSLETFSISITMPVSAPDSVFEVRMRAYMGQSPTAFKTYTFTSRPSNPIARVIEVRSGLVTLSWDPVAIATRYRVVRVYREIESLLGVTDQLSIADTNVLNGESYDYKVFAESLSGVSDATAVQASLVQPTKTPSWDKPYAIVNAGSRSYLQWYWWEWGDNGFTHAELWVSSNPNGPFTLKARPYLSYFIEYDLPKAGASQFYKVNYANGFGAGPSSDVFEVYVRGPVAAVKNLAATRLNYQTVNLSWDQNLSAAQFIVQRSPMNVVAISEIGRGNFNSFRDDNTNGQAYRYRVIAVAADGTLANPSNIAFATPSMELTRITSNSNGLTGFSGWTHVALNLGCGELKPSALNGTKALKFVGVFSATGSCLWMAPVTEASLNLGQIQINDAGEMIVGGRYDGMLELLGGPILPSPSSSISSFLANYSLAGVPTWARPVNGSIQQLEFSTNGDLLLLSQHQSPEFSGSRLTRISMADGSQRQSAGLSIKNNENEDVGYYRAVAMSVSSLDEITIFSTYYSQSGSLLIGNSLFPLSSFGTSLVRLNGSFQPQLHRASEGREPPQLAILRTSGNRNQHLLLKVSTGLQVIQLDENLAEVVGQSLNIQANDLSFHVDSNQRSYIVAAVQSGIDMKYEFAGVQRSCRRYQICQLVVALNKSLVPDTFLSYENISYTNAILASFDKATNRVLLGNVFASRPRLLNASPSSFQRDRTSIQGLIMNMAVPVPVSVVAQPVPSPTPTPTN